MSATAASVVVRDKPDPSPMEKLKARVKILEEELFVSKNEVSILKKDNVVYKEEFVYNRRKLDEMAKLVKILSSKLNVDIPIGLTDTFVDQVDDRQIELAYQGNNFDDNGLMYFIGSRGKTFPYVNPHRLTECGLASGMVASLSSIGMGGSGKPHAFLNHAELEINKTSSAPLSWMKVDIGNGRLMVVNHYCLRHGNIDSVRTYFNPGRFLRNWNLQASHTGGDDASEWVNLKIHNDDEKLNVYATVGDWTIEDTDVSRVGYQYFRIYQTGKNSHGGNTLRCSGIELYGTLSTNVQPC